MSGLVGKGSRRKNRLPFSVENKKERWLTHERCRGRPEGRGGAGQEFNRTKDGDHNSYMSPDSVNQFDWDRKDEYIETVEFVKGFINLRKELKALRLNTAEEIKQHVTVNKLEDRIIEYTISDVKAYGPYEEIKIFINPTHTPLHIELNDNYQLIANQTGVLNEQSTINHLTVDTIELVVLAK